ncbi:hypothetical protein RRG08_053067 [Elysia crispata]|uniref:Uncharacterized protein n=1 Tax=Elysia crispata TaxID=231223 RepID=A0AAE0XT02_9GAST|nr:hypothetical protein RRG08_053067 [Elysia crispata]
MAPDAHPFPSTLSWYLTEIFLRSGYGKRASSFQLVKERIPVGEEGGTGEERALLIFASAMKSGYGT